MRILANPATDSGSNRPPFGAKRRWGFIICPCGRNGPELRRLKQLDDENRRLKRLVADLTLDKQMLQDALSKKF
jgi:hypothetical protein